MFVYKHKFFKMTKLVEWLLGAALFLGIWSAIVTRKISSPVLDDNWTIVLYFPIIAIILFGVSFDVSSILELAAWLLTVIAICLCNFF